MGYDVKVARNCWQKRYSCATECTFFWSRWTRCARPPSAPHAARLTLLLRGRQVCAALLQLGRASEPRCKPGGETATRRARQRRVHSRLNADPAASHDVRRRPRRRHRARLMGSGAPRRNAREAPCPFRPPSARASVAPEHGARARSARNAPPPRGREHGGRSRGAWSCGDSSVDACGELGRAGRPPSSTVESVVRHACHVTRRSRVSRGTWV